MREFLLYDKGLGNVAIRAALMDGDLFYDFSAESFGAETEGSKAWMAEQASAAADTTAYYLAEFTVPQGGPYAVKIILDSTGDLIGTDLVWGGTEAETAAGAATDITVSDLIKAAYLNLGACDIEQGPTPAQYAQGLQALNAMLASWSRSSMTIYGLVQESFALTNGKSDYTVGSGAELDTIWPSQIVRAYIRYSSNFDYPVQIISQGQYDRLGLKSTAGIPRCLVYNPKGYPTGNAKLYPVPQGSYTLFWTAQKVITSYATLEAQLGLPPEYEEALEYNLTVRLAPKVGARLTPEIAALAISSKSAIPVDIEPAVFDGAFGFNCHRATIYRATIYDA
jgi:hypothetical protein